MNEQSKAVDYPEPFSQSYTRVVQKLDKAILFKINSNQRLKREAAKATIMKILSPFVEEVATQTNDCEIMMAKTSRLKPKSQMQLFLF